MLTYYTPVYAPVTIPDDDVPESDIEDKQDEHEDPENSTEPRHVYYLTTHSEPQCHQIKVRSTNEPHRLAQGFNRPLRWTMRTLSSLGFKTRVTGSIDSRHLLCIPVHQEARTVPHHHQLLSLTPTPKLLNSTNRSQSLHRKHFEPLKQRYISFLAQLGEDNQRSSCPGTEVC